MTMKMGFFISILIVWMLIAPTVVISEDPGEPGFETKIFNTHVVTRTAAASPWPMFRGNIRHTGVSPYNTSENPGKLRWRFQTGNDVTSSTAIGTDGTIYIGSDDNYLYAINSNGTEKWRFQTDDNIRSSPAIGYEGTIYFGSGDKCFYAINPNGTLKWKVNIDGYVHSSPVIGSDGVLYFGSGNTYVYAMNPNGTEKWKFKTEDSVLSSPAIDSDGIIYLSSYDNYTYALYPNGTLKWKFKIGHLTYSSAAIDSNGTIYMGSFNNTIYAINPNGTEKWRYETGYEVCSSPAIGSDGTVYVGSEDNNLYALNPDGTEKWRFQTEDKISRSSPVIGLDGTIYIGSLDNYLYAIHSNGTLKWKFKTNSEIYSSPAIDSNGTIYVGSMDDFLYAIGKTVPSSPRNLSATAWVGFINLSWSPPEDDGAAVVNEYRIYRSNYTGDYVFIDLVSGATTFYNDTSTVSGQIYFYLVTALNSIGESNSSNELLKISPGIPGPPDFEMVTAGDGYIDLSWREPVNNGGLTIIRYKIYRGIQSGAETYLDSVSPWTTSYRDPFVTNDQKYYYYITSVNDLGESRSSLKISATPKANPTVPSEPQNLNATGGDGFVTITWLAPTNNGGSPLKGYKIYRSTAFEKEEVIEFVDAFTKSYRDGLVINGQTYNYYITAVNNIGEGKNSSEVSVSPRLPGTGNNLTTQPEPDNSYILIASWIFLILIIIIAILFLINKKNASQRK